jgi:hypothetical protein
MAREIRDVHIIQYNPPGGGAILAGDHIEQRRFASAIRTDDGMAFSLFYSNIDSSENSQSVKVLGEI